jgi:hypothetical protein
MDFNYGKLWTGIGPLNHATTHSEGKSKKQNIFFIYQRLAPSDYICAYQA